MFKRYRERYTEAERRYWLAVRAGGRSRFIWHDKVRGSLFVWFFVSLGLALFGEAHSFSARNVFIYLTILPICLLSGYLNGVWTWKELDKKYPE